MIELRRPAPLLELAEMNAALTPKIVAAKGGLFAPAARHAALGRSWGAWLGGRCLACGGYAEVEPARFEAWFACRPAAAAHMAGIVLAARLTVRGMRQTANIEIRARVARGHRPGQRIARALGFGLEAIAGDVEIWRHGKSWRDDQAEPGGT